MTKRINKPLPYPYDSIFKNEENKIEDIFEKEDNTISASSEGSGAYSSGSAYCHCSFITPRK